MTDPRQSSAARVRREVKRLRQRTSRFWHQRRHLAVGLIVAGLIAVVGAGLLAYELLKRPADVHNSQRRLHAPEAAEAGSEDGQLADLRPQPGPHPLPAGQGREAAVSGCSGTTPSGRCWSSRRSTSAASSTASTTTARLRARRRHRQGPLGTPHRPAQRLLTGLLQAPPLHRQPRPRPHRQAGRRRPARCSGSTRFPAGRSPRRWRWTAPSTSAAKTASSSRSTPATATRAGRPRWAGRSSRRPPTTTVSLFVGDYGGYMNAVDAKTGKIKWQTARSARASAPRASSTRPRPSPSAASTPATTTTASTASTERTGALAWSHSTGGYVYSGPVVANTRHTPPTVYIGSFDGNIYALDAKNGETRWSARPGGQVVGSLSAVGDIVYVAEFTNGSTNGYEMKTGRQVFHYKTGHLHAGDLRRPPDLPGRLLEHQRAGAVQVKAGVAKRGGSACGWQGAPGRGSA